MAEDNAALVQGGFEALRRDGVDGLLPLIHPDFVATTPAALASEPDTYRGVAGVRRYFDSFYEAMDDIWFEGHEFIGAGDRVFVDFTLHATGRTTGIETGLHAFQVWTLKDGKAIGLELFSDRDAAIAATGT